MTGSFSFVSLGGLALLSLLLAVLEFFTQIISVWLVVENVELMIVLLSIALISLLGHFEVVK